MVDPNRVNRECGTASCPKCKSACPCVDHCEVDIGVGTQTWNHEHFCEEHGAWVYVSDGEYVFRDLGETVVDEDLRRMSRRAGLT